MTRESVEFSCPRHRSMEVDKLLMNSDSENLSGKITARLASLGLDEVGKLPSNERRQKIVGEGAPVRANAIVQSPVQPASQSKSEFSASIRITTTAKPKLWANLPVAKRNRRGLAKKQAAFKAAAPPPSQSLREDDGEVENDTATKERPTCAHYSIEKMLEEIAPTAEKPPLKRVAQVESSDLNFKSDTRVNQLPVVVDQASSSTSTVTNSSTRVNKTAPQIAALDIYVIPPDVANQENHVTQQPSIATPTSKIKISATRSSSANKPSLQPAAAMKSLKVNSKSDTNHPVPLPDVITNLWSNPTSKTKTSTTQIPVADKPATQNASIDIYDILSDIGNEDPDSDSSQNSPPLITRGHPKKDAANASTAITPGGSKKTAKTHLKTYSKKGSDATALARRLIPEAPSEGYLPQACDGEDERSQVPIRSSRKKRVSKSSDAKRRAQKSLISQGTSKKVPRRLPVNELLYVAERVEEPQSSLDADNVEPAELSDDLISQGSPDTVRRNLQQPMTHRLRKSKENKAKTSTQDLLVYRYRMPIAPTHSRMTARREASDGFEGKEANPIGKLMLVKEPHSLRQASIRSTPRIGVLELVDARADDDFHPVVKLRRSGFNVIQSQESACNNDASSLSSISTFDMFHFSGSDHVQLEPEMHLPDLSKTILNSRDAQDQETEKERQSRHELPKSVTRETSNLPSLSSSRKRSAHDTLADIDSAGILFDGADTVSPPRKSLRVGTSFGKRIVPCYDVIATEMDDEVCLDQEGYEPQYENRPASSVRSHSTLSQIDRIAERFCLPPIPNAVAIAEGKDMGDQGSLSGNSQSDDNMPSDESLNENDHDMKMKDTELQERLSEEDVEPDIDQESDPSVKACEEQNREINFIIRQLDTISERNEDERTDQNINQNTTNCLSEIVPSKFDLEPENHRSYATPGGRIAFRCGSQFDEEILGRDDEEFNEEEERITNRFGLLHDTLGEVHLDFWDEQQPVNDTALELLQDANDPIEEVHSQIVFEEKLIEDGTEAELREGADGTTTSNLSKSPEIEPMSSHGSLKRFAVVTTVQSENRGDYVEDVALPSTASQSLDTQESKRFNTQDYEVQDESWRPHLPRQSGQYVEVDDEIVDSSPRTHTRTQHQPSRSYHQSASQQPSRQGSLDLVWRKSSPDLDDALMYHSFGRQALVDLGHDYENIIEPRLKEIPETQFEELATTEKVELPESQQSYMLDIPTASYFERASLDLCNPNLWSASTRTKSGPAYTRSSSSRNEIGTSDIAPLSQRSISYMGTPRRVHGNTCGDPEEPMILQRLTRQASQNYGTMSNTGRKRTVSLPFKPPFKKAASGSQSMGKW